MAAHFCTSHPCPLCYPQLVYTTPPNREPWPLQGCICPPTSEKTCEAAMCPRKNHLSAAGHVGSPGLEETNSG